MAHRIAGHDGDRDRRAEPPSSGSFWPPKLSSMRCTRLPVGGLDHLVVNAQMEDRSVSYCSLRWQPIRQRCWGQRPRNSAYSRAFPPIPPSGWELRADRSAAGPPTSERTSSGAHHPGASYFVNLVRRNQAVGIERSRGSSAGWPAHVGANERCVFRRLPPSGETAHRRKSPS